MPVPTPRTVQVVQDADDRVYENEPFDAGQDDDIPDDWKDHGEVDLVVARCKPILEQKVFDAIAEETEDTDDQEPEHIQDHAQVERHDDPDEFEVDIRGMKQFWEEATSPAKGQSPERPITDKVGDCSPLASPSKNIQVRASLDTSNQESSGANLSDMATQTAISETRSTEVAVNVDDSELTETGSETEDTDTEASDKDNVVPGKILIPIEERRKAFEKFTIESKMSSSTKASWKSVPSGLDKTLDRAPPLPLVGALYPTSKWTNEITSSSDQPVRSIKESFEQKTETKVLLDIDNAPILDSSPATTSNAKNISSSESDSESRTSSSPTPEDDAINQNKGTQDPIP